MQAVRPIQFLHPAVRSQQVIAAMIGPPVGGQSCCEIPAQSETRFDQAPGMRSALCGRNIR